uniref:uncharacterized protein LOC122583754 n=1 Tax=Erigeron canadensis TaxID=72917 RepID=UPI001CB910EE|nr:uncharacterized protein LOC122583754 [Erigeron canadensis]
MTFTIITTLKHLQIPLEEVTKATNNFDEEYVIGGGGFGKVYRGQLSVSGGEMVNVAARRLNRKHRQAGDVEFWTEISVLSSLKHENIASLIGFCDEKGEKIIINKDEATRGSLSMYLGDPTLTWTQRLNICVGVARALKYIHNGKGRGDYVIHRNINSTTILLDDKWEAKLSGFEFSIKQSVNRMDRVVLSEAIGTKGYMDPSIVRTGGVSHKSDIYSFGVVLCELLCGRKAFIPHVVDVDDRFLASLFISHYENESLNDIILPDHMTQTSLTGFSKTAYSCLKENRRRRPDMNDILIELEKALELQQELENLRQNLGHLKIPLRSIMLATKNFSEAHPESNEVIIKRYFPGEHGLGEKLFFTDMKMLNTCKHPNIVKLLGFCVEGSERIIIIEHFNRTLSAYYMNDNLRPELTWERRLKICLDAANALNYLHNEMKDQKTIINRLIMSNGIVFDKKNWRAKMFSFTLSIFLPPNQDEALHNNPDGNPYYMDPEYIKSGKLKRESDVYSFGVLLFEVLCGRFANDPIYLKESDKGIAFVARRCIREGTLLMEMIDPLLKEKSVVNNCISKKSLEKFVKIAFECITETQDQRPTMKMVIHELHEALFFQNFYVADEVEESMELKFTREISIKKLEHLKIPLDDIKLATEDFHARYQLRADVCYILYRAQLEQFDEGTPFIKEGKNKNERLRTRNTVIIKRFFAREDGIGEEMFFTEMKMLNTCKHPNITKLLGICVEDSEMILVVEHLSNGYLIACWTRIDDMRQILTWEKRLKICLGVANGMNYICNEMEDQETMSHYRIRHFLIGLDENWEAKITDFVILVVPPPNQDDNTLYLSSSSTPVLFIDQVYWETGKLKREFYVYFLGLIMFEVLCGRSAYDPIYFKESEEGLAFVARRCFQEEGTLIKLIDPVLREESGENCFTLKRGPNKYSFEKFVKVALGCTDETYDQRPTLKVVIQELQDALSFQKNKDDLIILLDDIQLATENFHDKNCIGGGGFGKVYKGKVPQGDGFNTIVAKRLDTRLGQGELQFRTELQVLFEYKHENIIPLIGYCDEKNEQIIVYEYAPQGSLDKCVRNAGLTWMLRLNICIDVATALAFLHGGAGKQAIVIHRDIKTPNILLNDKWNAKLADFGLSLISPINQETDYVIDHVCGTRGYLDPLYLKSRFLTKESDIYSFGVVLFEIICGKFLTGAIVKEIFEKGNIDDFVFEAIKKQIEPKALIAFKTIAYRCLHDDREKRPTAKEVLQRLKEAREFQVSGSLEAAAYCMEAQLNI